MQSPIKLNKINPKLSGSRRQSKSYMDRYHEKAKGTMRTGTNINHFEDQSLREEYSSRGERIMQIISVGGDVQNIKIEQQLEQYQMMKNQYTQTELLWSKKMSQARVQINDLKQNIKNQQKQIKQMQKQLSNRRMKFVSLQQKLKKTAQQLEVIPIQQYQHEIYSLQEQYDMIYHMGEKQITEAKAEKDELQKQNEQIDQQLRDLQAQIQSLAQYQSLNFNSNLTILLQEQKVLKQEIESFEIEVNDVSKNIKDMQVNRPIKQQVHRQYLELYEKMFINGQLDKMIELTIYKDEEIQRLDEYGKRKFSYSQKKKSIQVIQSRITAKKQIISNLQLQVRDKSTILLNLYQMQSNKIR